MAMSCACNLVPFSGGLSQPLLMRCLGLLDVADIVAIASTVSSFKQIWRSTELSPAYERWATRRRDTAREWMSYRSAHSVGVTRPAHVAHFARASIARRAEVEMMLQRQQVEACRLASREDSEHVTTYWWFARGQRVIGAARIAIGATLLLTALAVLDLVPLAVVPVAPASFTCLLMLVPYIVRRRAPSALFASAAFLVVQAALLSLRLAGHMIPWTVVASPCISYLIWLQRAGFLARTLEGSGPCGNAYTARPSACSQLSAVLFVVSVAAVMSDLRVGVYAAWLPAASVAAMWLLCLSFAPGGFRCHRVGRCTVDECVSTCCILIAVCSMAEAAGDISTTVFVTIFLSLSLVFSVAGCAIMVRRTRPIDEYVFLRSLQAAEPELGI